MPTLCKPAVAVPEHVITLEQTLELCERLLPDHPQLRLAQRLIRNTGVMTRHLVRPLDEILTHPGFEIRNRIHDHEARRRVPPVVNEALANAKLTPNDIDLVVFVSCTAFTMPSPTAWLINDLGLKPATRQIPIAQLGCAAGGAAINLAGDLCRAHPTWNALIVACEFCSLSFQPTDTEVNNILSDGLFGDAIGAAIIRGHGGEGLALVDGTSWLVPNTERWIRYDIKATGFHFRVHRNVPDAIEAVAPILKDLAAAHAWDAAALDMYVVHAGGPRILEALANALGVDAERFAASNATLRDNGNIASVTVLDTLRRTIEDSQPRPGDKGAIVGFGPGVTAELCLGTWSN